MLRKIRDLAVLDGKIPQNISKHAKICKDYQKNQRMPCQSTAWMNLAAESESEPAKHPERPFAPVNFSISVLWTKDYKDCKHNIDNPQYS